MVTKKYYRLLLLAFFLSGLAALIYEVVWARKLGLVFGTTAYAISTVLAVFFTGLALGSFIFGKLVDKYQRPLLTYALLELGIGIYALFTPQIFELIKSLQISFWQRVSASGGPTYSGFSLFTFLLSAAGLLLPTTLMGGTLPAISKFFVSQKETLGEKVSLLYAVNTTGAVVGTILAGFFLIILFGVNGAIYFAAVVNILIGLIAFGLSRIDTNLRRIDTNKQISSLADIRFRFASISILAAYAASGFAALALEVLWTRVLVMILGSSTYAFSVMLVTFLFGIALGSAVVSKFIDKKENVLPYFVVTQVLIGLFVILSIPAFDRLPLLFLEILARFKEQFWALQLAEFLFCSLVMLVPTLLMGATFPMVVKAYKASGSRLRQGFGGQVGSRVGEVYGANTIGGVGGSLAAGFLLIPLLGIQKSIFLSGLIYLAVAGAIFLILPARRKIKVLTLGGILGVLLFGFLLSPWNKNLVSSGVFIYGDLYLRPQPTEIIFYKEGLSSTVTVRKNPKDKALFLQINGKIDASSKGDLPTEVLSGHLPMLFHPDPKEVLIIGLGSGITLGAVEQYQELKKVEMIEIEPAVVEGARLFSDYNHNALVDSRLSLILGDGRNYLLATNKKYDVITAEPSNLWIAGMGNLFAKEYFEIMKGKLKEDGIVLQWVHLYSLGEQDLKTVIRTFQKVFPRTTVWILEPEMKDLALIGFTGKEKINLDLVEERFRKEKIANDFKRIGLEDPSQLISFFLLDSQAASTFSARSPLNTDEHPILEFSTPKSFYQETIAANLAALKDFQKPATLLLADSMKREEVEKQFEVRKNLIEAEILFRKGKFGEAAPFIEKAYQLDSTNKQIKQKLTDVLFEAGKELFIKGEKEKAVEQFKKVLSFEPEHPLTLSQLGEIYITQGKLEEAKLMLEKAILIDPSLSVAHMDLGIVYGERKEFEKAEEELKKAIELEPTSFEAHNNLAHLYNLQTRRDLALEHWQASLKINPRQPEIRQIVKYVERLKRLR